MLPLLYNKVSDDDGERASTDYKPSAEVFDYRTRKTRCWDVFHVVRTITEIALLISILVLVLARKDSQCNISQGASNLRTMPTCKHSSNVKCGRNTISDKLQFNPKIFCLKKTRSL